MKNLKKNVVFLFLVFGIVVFLLLINNSLTALKVPKALILKDYGFTAQMQAEDLVQVSFGMEVENPNKDFINCNASVRITYKGEDEKVIVSEERILPVIFSESVQGFAINTSISQPVLSVEAELVTEDAFFIPKCVCDLENGLSLQEINRATYAGTPTISGRILNNNDAYLREAEIFVIFRNEFGKITGGATAMLRHLPEHEKRPFSVFCEGRNLEKESFSISASCQYQYLPMKISATVKFGKMDV